ncbi:hypothetical protein EGW08_000769 [Elysia chlorotica]|uniref:Endonuclease V n=1 Tax=Elysia chlorotica TaxID=188477 RepID=A0A433UC80_ELYCH|nr:hypothetical protein EGW08_000769 [Elysia chlorotica]
MDFCCKCGILVDTDLSLVLDQSASFCNPCFEISKKAKFDPHTGTACDCEICYYDNNSRDATSNSPTVDLYSEVNQQNLSPDTKPLPQRKSKTKKKFKNRQTVPSVSSKVKGSPFRFSTRDLPSDDDTETQSDIQFVKNLSPCQVDEDWSSVNVDWSSETTDAWPVKYSTDSLPDSQNYWGNADLTSPWGELDDLDFPILVSSSQSGSMGLTSSISKPKSNPVRGKVEERDPQQENHGGGKNYSLVEEVREKWEREQKEYCAKMSPEDTDEIAALVGGRRRKANGDRYFVGGVDISFIKGNNEDACACLSVLRMPDLKLVYQRMEMVKLTQPYIPGFLAFREVPALEPLFHHLKTVAPQYWPDITLVDGNGKLHPRGFGLACHLGVVLDIPTMGVAKSLISAQGISEDEEHKKLKRNLMGAGDGFDLVSDRGEVLGKCLRVHDGAPNPVYISVGHKVSLQSAVWIALECSMYRIPEPVRRADLDSREYLRQGKTEPEEFVLSEDEEDKFQ